MAGVIAIYVWQMLLPLRLTLLPTYLYFLADVIARIVADVITTINVWADVIAQCIFIKYYG